MDAMQYSDSKIHRISRANSFHNSIDCDISFSSNDKPMLSALLVALIRKALSRIYPDAFHFVRRTFLEYLIVTPRAFRFLEHFRILVFAKNR
jgi:hypothetical protein